MAQVILNEPGIRPLVRQGVAAGMAEHVRMHSEGEGGELPVFLHGQVDGRAVQRRALLADEEHLAVGLHAGTFGEPGLDHPQLVAAQRVGGGEPALESGDVQHPTLGVHLVEFEAAGFRDPQAMAEHEQQQAPVPGLVPAALDGGQEVVEFASCEVFSLAHRFVESRPWRKG